MPAPTLIELVWLVAIAFVWGRGSIFKHIREWPPLSKLLDCPLCSGFWIGLLGHFVYVERPEAITLLGVGSLVGTLTLALCALIRRL